MVWCAVNGTTQPLILRVCSTLRNVRVPCPRVYACVCPVVGEWEGGVPPLCRLLRQSGLRVSIVPVATSLHACTGGLPLTWQRPQGRREKSKATARRSERRQPVRVGVADAQLTYASREPTEATNTTLEGSTWPT